MTVDAETEPAAFYRRCPPFFVPMGWDGARYLRGLAVATCQAVRDGGHPATKPPTVAGHREEVTWDRRR